MLMGRPGFRQAVARYCEKMIEPAPPGWPVRKLLNQLGRYYAGYMLIRQYYAWAGGSGATPTLSLLQAHSGLSPRQTTTFVATLKAGQLLEVETVAGDRRARVLKPLPRLVREIGRSCLAFVAAYDEVIDGGPALAPPVDARPDILGRMIHLSADRVLETGTVIAPFPTVRAMAGYDCGYPLLVAVMASYYRRRAGLVGPALAYSALAERFQISQSHVGNVFAYLRQAGALERAGSEETVTAVLVAEFEAWCAAEMAHYARLVAPLVASARA